MTPAMLALAGAVALGVLFWAIWCWRDGGGIPKVVVKTGSTALLAGFAYLAGGPWLLVAALALSSLGDAFLALEGETWLKPGMAAFFLAHVAYIVLFWGLPLAEKSWLIPVAQAALAIGGIAYVRWLSPSLGEMRIPVFAYTGIILLMGGLVSAFGAFMFQRRELALPNPTASMN